MKLETIIEVLLIVIFFSIGFFAVADTPKSFITPEMIYRRGLTDEQYEHLWKLGRKPSIDPTTARNWMFKSYRFANTTNWLNIVGRTNNFAKLSYYLQDANAYLETTNKVLVATNRYLTAACERLEIAVEETWGWYTNQLAQTTAYSNAYVIADRVAKTATAKIQDEIADLEAKIVKYEEYKTKYPLLKTVWNALIADAQNRIKVLKALGN